MSVDLTFGEKETHFNMTGDARSIWHVYSDDEVMQRRLEKITRPVRIDGPGRYYELQASQVRFYALPTSEQRQEYQKRGQRLKRVKQVGTFSAQN